MYKYKLKLRKGENNLTGIPNESVSFTSTTFYFPMPSNIHQRERGSDRKESACNAGDLGLIPGSGRSLDEGKGYPLEYSCPENPMDRGAWRATVHGVAKSWTRLSMHAHTHCVSLVYSLCIQLLCQLPVLIQLILETTLFPAFQLRKLSPET